MTSPLLTLSRLSLSLFFAGLCFSCWVQAEESSPQTPVNLEADQLHRENDTVHAEGNVHIEYDDWKTEGEKLDYNLITGQLTSPTKIHIQKPGLVIEGQCADVNLNQYHGEVEKPSLTLLENDKQPARYITANHLTIKDEDHVALSKVRYTGCPGEKPDWWIQSGSLELDQAKGIGETRDTTLYFKGVPLFYTPWMDFSLTGERKSGLLPPTIGTSSLRGFEFQLPIYLNLAPNYDATITPHWMSKRGLQLGSQFRYLTENHKGELYGEVLPNDQVTGFTRRFLSWKNTSTFTDWNGGSTLRVNLNSVSDPNYFVDLSDRVSATSQGALPREVDWSKNFATALDTQGLLRVRVQRFQTLQILPSGTPYERSPQVNLTTNTPLTALSQHLSLYTKAEGARFTQATQSPVDRGILYPQLRYTVHTPGTFFEGHLGLNGRFYKENDTTTQLWTPITSLDEHLYFDPKVQDDYHPAIETRAYYVYIPYRDQSAIRTIDSTPYTSDDLGLFVENDFTGSDRINDANRMTLAMNARWKNQARDSERLMLGVAQRFSFQPPQISPGNFRSRNPFFLYGRGEMGPGFNWNAGTTYDVDKHITQDVQGGFQYRPNDRALINTIYRFQRYNPITFLPNETWRQIDVSGQWEFSKQWKSVWRWNYDIENSKTLEALGGLEYTRGCWGVRAVAQRLVTSATTSSHAFFIQLELMSLGNIGSNPIDVLRRSIPGYIDPHTSSGFSSTSASSLSQ